MKKVDVYTDGACSGNPGKGGWCAIIIYGKNEKVISDAEEATTNNRMELLAAINGLEALTEPCEVTLYSDSAYLVNAVNCGWLDKWQKTKWRTSDNTAVCNRDLWERLIATLLKHKVNFVKVKAHRDDFYNNRCDREAKNAISNILTPEEKQKKEVKWTAMARKAERDEQKEKTGEEGTERG